MYTHCILHYLITVTLKREKNNIINQRVILSNVTEQTKIFSFFHSWRYQQPKLCCLLSQVRYNAHFFFTIDVVCSCMLVNVVFSFLWKKKSFYDSVEEWNPVNTSQRRIDRALIRQFEITCADWNILLEKRNYKFNQIQNIINTYFQF